MGEESEKISDAEIVAEPAGEVAKSVSGPPAAGLRETEGEVYLPVRHCIEPDSEEFQGEIVRCLPGDVAPTVLAARAASRRVYRRIEIIAILVLLLGVGWFVYSYFPSSLPALPFKFEWRYAGPRFPLDSAYADVYREARADFDADRYEAVIRKLDPAVAELAGEGAFAGYDELFYIYFVAAGRSVSRFTEWRQAQGVAELLAQADPDNLGWNYFLVMLKRRSFGAPEDFYRGLEAGRYRAAWERELGRIRQTVGDIQVLRVKVGEVKNPPGDRETIVKQLDLWEAELAALQWLLEGGKGGTVLPDNGDSPGVAARERAWRLALKYDADAASLDFLRLRLFVLETLRRNSLTPFNNIHLGGVNRRNAWLDDEIAAVRRRLPVEYGGGGAP